MKDTHLHHSDRQRVASARGSRGPEAISPLSLPPFRSKSARKRFLIPMLVGMPELFYNRTRNRFGFKYTCYLHTKPWVRCCVISRGPRRNWTWSNATCTSQTNPRLIDSGRHIAINLIVVQLRWRSVPLRGSYGSLRQVVSREPYFHIFWFFASSAIPPPLGSPFFLRWKKHCTYPSDASLYLKLFRYSFFLSWNFRHLAKLP